MADSTLFQTAVMDQSEYVAGYALVKKTSCEVFNYISPTLRILRFLEGSAQWQIDGSVESFEQGDIVILSNISKRNIHQLRSPYLLYEVFDFYPSRLASEQLWFLFYQRIHKIPAHSQDRLRKTAFLLDCLKEEILSRQDDMQIFSVQRLLELLALNLKRSMAQEVQLPLDPALARISRSVQYIAEHFREPLSIGELAANCSYSPEHYSRMFHKYIGISPMKYLTNIRLEQVIHLINTKSISIVDAALQCGFRSSAAFYKAFRANYPSTPKAFRNVANAELG